MNRRGFTLIEVILAVAILAVIVAGLSVLLVQQSLQSAKQELQRTLESNGRLALLEIAGAVRRAGYGIAPTAAFDFDRYACTTPGLATTCPNGVGRDRTDGTDELVVAWRDPSFSRLATSITGTAPNWTVNFAIPLTAQLKSGRIVQLLCDGAEPSSYVAIRTDAAVGDTALQVRSLTNADGYFPATAPADACFGTAAILLVDRRRYYIANDPTGMPSLYRDRGLGVAELIQRGIEDLQITYAIGAPPTGSAFAAAGATPATVPEDCSGTRSWAFGACVGTAEQPLHTATAPDWRGDGYDSVNRYTAHPANIRSVTINVVARAGQNSPDKAGDDLPILGNRAARARAVFSRSIFSVTEATPNMLTRAHFLPPVTTGANVGGG